MSPRPLAVALLLLGTACRRPTETQAPADAAPAAPPGPAEILVTLGEHAPRDAVWSGPQHVVVGLGRKILHVAVATGETSVITLPEEVHVAGARGVDVAVGLGTRAVHVVEGGVVTRAIPLGDAGTLSPILGLADDEDPAVQISDDGKVVVVPDRGSGRVFSAGGAVLAHVAGDDARLDPTGTWVATRDGVYSARDGRRLAEARSSIEPVWVSGRVAFVELEAVQVTDPATGSSSRRAFPCRGDGVVRNAAVDEKGGRVLVDCRDRIAIVSTKDLTLTEIPLPRGDRFVPGPGEEGSYGPSAPVPTEDGDVLVDRRWSKNGRDVRLVVATKQTSVADDRVRRRLSGRRTRGPCAMEGAGSRSCDEVASPDRTLALALAPPSIALLGAKGVVARWGPPMATHTRVCRAAVDGGGLDLDMCLATGGGGTERRLRIGPRSTDAPDQAKVDAGSDPARRVVGGGKIRVVRDETTGSMPIFAVDDRATGKLVARVLPWADAAVVAWWDGAVELVGGGLEKTLLCVDGARVVAVSRCATRVVTRRFTLD